jgi:aminobenzoyl-glutamate utilization protein B
MKRALLLGVLWAARAAAASEPSVVEAIDARRDHYHQMARRIWSFAEVGYQEQKSSALLQEELARAGFAVKPGVADMPTAFVASWGSGRPVIAIIGEFDALPGLSQDAVPERRPLAPGGPGHGCGHHLFGTASMGAAIAVKDWLAAGKRPGTVRFYGTPAEEGGGGKIYMIRAGLFDDVDAALAWHPGDRNQATPESTLANVSAKFRFRGAAAHASASPEKGRSALDGVEAMNHMVNLMREHVPQASRIHYIVTRGGEAPNIVPDFAEAFYYARHPDMRVLDSIWERIRKAADGAALGTGTAVEVELINAVYNILPNVHLSFLQRRNLQKVGGVRYSAEEQAFAEALRKSLPADELPLGSQERVLEGPDTSGKGSTDFGDVTWVVPAAEFTTATWVPGTPAHSWQAVACGGTGIGTKGMLVAAKTLALTAVDLLQDPAHLEKARAEFDRRRGAFRYAPRIGDRKPPLDYRR